MKSKPDSSSTQLTSARSGDRRPPKRDRPQLVFVVHRTERISSHLVRVHLGGPAFDSFVNDAGPDRLAATDKYVKLLFARPDLGLVPPYDLDALRASLTAAEFPVRRTYTVRSVDEMTRTIAIDFVIHGDDGVAGPWAATARPGDLLPLSGPGGQYLPGDGANSVHLLVGDDSAIPAIAATLAALPADADGLATIEVDGPGDELALEAPVGVEVRWLHRSAPGAGGAVPCGELLVTAVRALDPPDRSVRVFAHGERAAMKVIGAVMVDDWGLDRRSLSLSAYWALGRAEDRFQAEKRDPVGQILAE